jgi:hypothetical protein
MKVVDLFRITIFSAFLMQGIFAGAQNLVAWYPFDNSTSDFSGNGNDGKAYGGVTITTDRFGDPCGALHFNGRDAYVDVHSSSSLKSPQKNLTVSCWFRLDSNSTGGSQRWLTIACKGTNRDETYTMPQYRVQVMQSDIQSTISLHTDFTEYDTAYNQHRVISGHWYFYALVYDGRFVRTYLDGRETWKFPYDRVFLPNDDDLNIGRDIPGTLEYFAGSLDDLRIYNSSLNAGEILSLYQTSSTKKDKEILNLSCPENLIINAEEGECFARVYPNKVSVDLTCGDVITHQTAGLPAGSKFPVGVSTISCEGKTASGEKKICTYTITVMDQEPPAFNCPNDTVIRVTDPSATSIPFTVSTPAAKDNCGRATVQVSGDLPVENRLPIGRSRLVYTSVDDFGNKKECVQQVLVLNSSTVIRDSSACPADIIQHTDAGRCGAYINYTMPVSILGKRYRLVSGLASGKFFPYGATVNKFQKTENGATQECSFTVTVQDDEKPVITCHNDTTIYSPANATSVPFNYDPPEASDNCQVDSLYPVAGYFPGSVLPLGITKIVYRAVDHDGNFAECGFTVTVMDTNIGRASSREKTETKTYLKDKVHYVEDMKFKKNQVTVVLCDNAQEDGDIVSVFFNGEEIVKQETLRTRSNGVIIRTVTLLKGRNDFIVKAWNNGKVSPNTIRIEFYEGDYHEALARLNLQKPKKSKVLNSKPGVAGAISLIGTGN